MITRIVKLTIQADKTKDFENLVMSYSGRIRSSNGCHSLQVLRDISHPLIFFTYSTWNNENSLNAYRNSELFQKVWGTAKTFFSAKPEAWTVTEITENNRKV